MYDVVYMYDFDLILIFFIFSIDVNYSKILMKNVFRRVCILFYYVVDVFHLGICFSFFFTDVTVN